MIFRISSNFLTITEILTTEPPTNPQPIKPPYKSTKFDLNWILKYSEKKKNTTSLVAFSAALQGQWIPSSASLTHCDIFILSALEIYLSNSSRYYKFLQTCQPYQFPPCEHHMIGPRRNCSKYSYTPPCRLVCQSKYNISYKEDLLFGNVTVPT